ncbi:calcium-binding protein [Halomontanus rarus]|uniref:calcium-binding protein n=1 Tax=Halomontanus rarus TaxID=3034020 RepID=UPI0023E8076E|nr:calcium-binding protein [Halovivax sp. TS33]
MTDQETTGDSRRSFMAKGALATGALALGTGTFGTATVGAQDTSVAVFANNYYPGADFDVVAPLQTSTTVDILQVDGETVSEISQPDDWTGHVIRYDIGQQAGITTFLFARDQSLSAGDSGTIGEDASVLSSELNLLNTSLNGGGSDDGAVEEDDSMEDNETAENNETGGD